MGVSGVVEPDWDEERSEDERRVRSGFKSGCAEEGEGEGGRSGGGVGRCVARGETGDAGESSAPVPVPALAWW